MAGITIDTTDPYDYGAGSEGTLPDRPLTDEELESILSGMTEGSK